MRFAHLALALAASVLACGGEPHTEKTTAPALAPSGEPALPGVEHPDETLVAHLRAALEAKPAGYEPRTEHREAAGPPQYTNRLILETSPYLLQHAHNPVNWHPWGNEAFERARREGKPVLLSIGYSTCHWCHVMERESFEDVEIATFMNRHFVAIKVDREERPDLDDVYMQAVQIMTGGGGWPMTLALTPDREPFFGGTYFPPRDGVRGARQGFLTILGELSAVYDRDAARVVEQAKELSARMRESTRARPPAGMPGAQAIYLAASRLARAFDPHWGGFGQAPKFPQPSAHELLLRYFRRTNDAQALHIVVATLEKMAAGGIHDHVGGGFHRYATDRHWLVPHFEKMLYDNAQLASLYLDAYQITHREDFAYVARATLDYVAREMTSPHGAFYSATDADSPKPNGEHEEGWFFTWTAGEILDLLGADRARLVRDYFGVTETGNFEGRNILHVARPLDDAAATAGMTAAEARAQIDAARRVLYDARAKRSAPLRDEKILTAWNALMISAFARAGFVLEDPGYVDRARRAADFVLTRMRTEDGRLHRSFKDTASVQAGYLEDYACFIQALIDLYEASWEPRWLEAALALQGKLDEGFFDDEAGGYFMTSDAHEQLILRRKPAYDGAEPSGNSVATLNLLRLAELSAREDFYQRAESSLQAFGSALTSGATSAPKMLSALDFYLDQPLEVVVIGAERDHATSEELLDAARNAWFPNRFFSAMLTEEAAEQQAHLIPLLEGKRPMDGRSTAYVCKRGYCERPTSDAEKFARQLITVDPLGADGELPGLPIVERP